MFLFIFYYLDGLTSILVRTSGYVNSCQEIVLAIRRIASAITYEIYVLGNPPASVVAFASQDSNVDVLEVVRCIAFRPFQHF